MRELEDELEFARGRETAALGRAVKAELEARQLEQAAQEGASDREQATREVKELAARLQVTVCILIAGGL